VLAVLAVFTLIELLAVIAIIAVLAAMLLPALSIRRVGQGEGPMRPAQGTLRIDAYDNTPDKATYQGHTYSDKAPGTTALVFGASTGNLGMSLSNEGF
jgi:prepilin-type N-terminal cleavage/methylation domain-containing protein